MISNKCSTIIRLPSDIKIVESYIESFNEWAILSLEPFRDDGVQFGQLSILNYLCAYTLRVYSIST